MYNIDESRYKRPKTPIIAIIRKSLLVFLTVPLGVITYVFPDFKRPLKKLKTIKGDIETVNAVSLPIPIRLSLRLRPNFKANESNSEAYKPKDTSQNNKAGEFNGS